MKLARWKNVVVVLFIVVIIVTVFLWPSLARSQINLTSSEIIRYQDQAQKILQSNLLAANEENIEAYLASIVSEGHHETGIIMADFFRDFDVQHELLDFELTEVSEDKLMGESRQRTTGISHLEDRDYRDHIATVLLVFVQEEGQWKISESSISDIEFIP